MAEIKVPELYLTSSNPDYRNECNRAFSGKVNFVRKRDLVGALDEIGSRYPTGTAMAVDDQPLMAEIYGGALRSSGMKLNFYSSPLTALDALRSGMKPDVIFSNVQMPEMNGFEFMKEVMKIYRKGG